MTERDVWPEPDMRLVDDDRVPAPILDNDALPSGWEAWIAAEAAPPRGQLRICHARTRRRRGYVRQRDGDLHVDRRSGLGSPQPIDPGRHGTGSKRTAPAM